MNKYFYYLYLSFIILGMTILYVISAPAQLVSVAPKPTAAVCAYNTSPPTATSGTFILLQCDATGKVLLH